MRKTTSGILLVAMAGTINGFTGLISNMLDGFGFTSADVAFTRDIIPLIPLVIMLLVTDPKGLRVRLKDLWIFVLMGAFKAGSDITYFKSMTMMPISIASVLGLMSPIFILVLAFIIFRTPITKRKVAATFLCLFGAALVTGVFSESSSIGASGIFIGLLSAFFFACYLMISETAVKRGYKPYTLLLYMLIFSGLCVLPFSDVGTVYNGLFHTESYSTMVMLGIFVTLLPTTLIMTSYSKVDSSIVSIVSLLEVPSSAVVGFFILNQVLNVSQIIGIAMVLASSAILDMDFDKIAAKIKARKLEMKRFDIRRRRRPQPGTAEYRSWMLGKTFALIALILVLISLETFIYAYRKGSTIDSLAYVCAVGMVAGAAMYITLSSRVPDGELTVPNAFGEVLKIVGGVTMFIGAFSIPKFPDVGLYSVVIGGFMLYSGYVFAKGDVSKSSIASVLFIAGVVGHLGLSIIEFQGDGSQFLGLCDILTVLLCILFLLDRSVLGSMFRDIRKDPSDISS